MAITLAPLTAGPFVLYRDPSLGNEMSMLSWTDPYTLPQLPLPKRSRRNLVPNGSFKDPSPIPVEATTVTFHPTSSYRTDEWSASGPRSLEFYVDGDSTNLEIYSNPDIPVVRGRPHSLGVTVQNVTGTDRTFRLYLTDFESTSAVDFFILNEASERLEILDFTPRFITSMSHPIGTYQVTKLYWGIQVQGPGDSSTPQLIRIDDVFLGEGTTASYVEHIRRPAQTLSYGEPMHLFCRNSSSAPYKNVRVTSRRLATDLPRPWLEVSPDPGTTPWKSAALSSVIVSPNTIVPSDSVDFWIRPVIDASVPEDEHRLYIKLTADHA